MVILILTYSDRKFTVGFDPRNKVHITTGETLLWEDISTDKRKGLYRTIKSNEEYVIESDSQLPVFKRDYDLTMPNGSFIKISKDTVFEPKGLGKSFTVYRKNNST